MERDITFELPIKKSYILPSIGYTLLIFANLYCYRSIDSIQINSLNYIAFLFLIWVYISTGHRKVLMKKELMQLIEKTKGRVEFTPIKHRLFSFLHAVLICIIASILLIQEMHSAYQTYIDVIFFVFLITEFYRGLNAGFQNRIILNLLQKKISKEQDK